MHSSDEHASAYLGNKALLPAIGAGLVWVPVALYFLMIGAIWQSIALTAWGVLVIGLIDNVLVRSLLARTRACRTTW